MTKIDTAAIRAQLDAHKDSILLVCETCSDEYNCRQPADMVEAGGILYCQECGDETDLEDRPLRAAPDPAAIILALCDAVDSLRAGLGVSAAEISDLLAVATDDEVDAITAAWSRLSEGHSNG